MRLCSVWQPCGPAKPTSPASTSKKYAVLHPGDPLLAMLMMPGCPTSSLTAFHLLAKLVRVHEHYC